MKNTSVKTAVVISDTHFQASLNGGLVAPMFCHDPNAISIMVQIMEDLQPDIIVHLGDICEMGVISHWAEVAGQAGKAKGDDDKFHVSAWADTMQMVKDFWKYVRTNFPNAELHQLEGNHDNWSDTFFKRPILAPFADELAFRKLKIWKEYGIKYYPYSGNQATNQPWVDIGKVRIMHGYKNVSVSRMLREHDNMLYGHQHKILYNAWDASSREMRRAHCIGCLTKLKPDYNSTGGQQNGWAHGFAVVNTLPNQMHVIKQVEILGGNTVPDFDGKTYYAKPLGAINPLLKSLELPI